MALTMEEMAKKIEVLEKEVRLVRDIQEIEQLHYQYIDSLFMFKWDDLEEVFAEEAGMGSNPDPNNPGGEERQPPPPMADMQDMPRTRTPADVVKGMKAQAEGGNLNHTGGFVVHPIIKIDGDRATGHWVLYIMLSYQLTNQLLFFLQRTYDTVYVRENGKWKISEINVSKSRLGPDMAKDENGNPLAPPYPGT